MEFDQRLDFIEVLHHSHFELLLGVPNVCCSCVGAFSTFANCCTAVDNVKQLANTKSNITKPNPNE